MPRRTSVAHSHLQQVKASNLFDSSRWAQNASPVSDSRDTDGEGDENITRLLSESDSSMDRSAVANSQRGCSSAQRADGAGRLSPFNAIDFGTPLAAAGSPTVMEDDDDLSMDVSGESAPDDLYERLNVRGHLFAESPTEKRHLMREDITANTSSESCKDYYSHNSSHTFADSYAGSARKRRHVSRTPPLGSRPLPDQSAFEQDRQPYFKQPSGAPVCPPTPVRTPGWDTSGISDVSEELIIRTMPFPSDNIDIEDEFSSWGRQFQRPAPVIFRQNSLEDTKVLMVQSESSDSGEGHDGNLNSSHILKGRQVVFLRDFAVENLIGSGNFAEVYKVQSREDGALYAVKKMKQQFRSRKYRDYLLTEVKMMKAVGHGHCKQVLRFIQAWQEDGYFYVQVGLAAGGCLKDFLMSMIDQQRLIPDDTLWHILHDVAAGLEHIHSCGIVHLDIKPANLLIDNGTIVIGDFGMASDVGNKDDGREGDTRYMAPELLDLVPRLPSADLFSMGLTMYELSYSKAWLDRGRVLLPAEGSSWQDLRHGRFLPIESRPAPLANAVHALLSPVPESRPSTKSLLAMQEVIRAGQTPDELLLHANASSITVPSFGRSLSISIPSNDLTNSSRGLHNAITPH